MELLRFSDLECHYGAREIFSSASSVVNGGERIGLVGPNGAGKSSLLRLLAGIDQPYGGTIARAKGSRLGYLAQGVADETESTLQQLIDAALSKCAPEEWRLRSKALRVMLSAFGFEAPEYERPLRAFSGGQRAKAALAHLLIDEPDYFILDEPTNHLDVATVRWLETFIANDKRGYIVVSHDRYFLDRVSTRIWEIDRGRLHAYAPARPAYTAYVAEKELRLEAERRAYEAFVAERDKRRTTIAGLRATHTSSDYSQVRSREKQLARVEATTQTPPPAAPARSIAVRLQSSRPVGGGFAFEATGLGKSYTQALFSGLTLGVERGERLGVVGPNGSGKSTFLKLLTAQVQPDAGSIRFNPAAKIASFAQNSHDQLDVTKSAVDNVLTDGHVTPQEARGLLGRMRISGDAADNAVRDFSGGERRRIMLACLMARKADVLLLDEPTNDFDIDSREALESVLCEYEGAIVVVSHDRFLLSRLCDRVLWIEGGTWGVVDGGYDVYETSQREREKATFERSLDSAAERPKTSRQTPLRIRSQLRTRIARIEREIERIDARAAEIERLFELPETYADRARAKALSDELAELKTRSRERVTQWEALLRELEGVRDS
ncbi:MAG TPA: ABC-F family ATP-binding cassette domain-containing protein [Candidatus Baltobacteraceae bacterium]|nr:ABC-F family ATP-binding cassette domain-containing protein [Candidatus Baltobacteraceae bacterium]